jgi:hypothetical protein
VIPAFVHGAPALAAALAEIWGYRVVRESIDKKTISFLFMI